MKLKMVLFLFASFTSISASAFCGVDGAFGIKFGDKVGKDAVRLEGGKAATYYSVKVPNPNPVFDEYKAKVNTKTKKIMEISAHKIITPMVTSMADALNPEQIAEGKAKARAAAESFLAMLTDEQLNNIFPNEYGSPQWELLIEKKIMLQINGYGPWEADVRCTSIAGEHEILKRVWPELYE